MRVFMPVFAALTLTACKGGEPEETDDDISCVADGTYDIAVTGKVADASGAGVEGAAVELRDYGWTQGASLGAATTNAQGIFVLDAIGVTDVPNCWGTLLDYTLVATEGGRSGEKQINSNLHSAIDDGSLNTDITAFPISIE